MIFYVAGKQLFFIAPKFTPQILSYEHFDLTFFLPGSNMNCNAEPLRGVMGESVGESVGESETGPRVVPRTKESVGPACCSFACEPKVNGNGAEAFRLTAGSKIDKRLVKLQAYRRTLSMYDAQSANVLGTVRVCVVGG